MAQKTYYEILQVSESATTAEIRKAYRLRAAECHPDKVMHLDETLQEEARRRMVLINEAYGVLNDEARRQEYDEYTQVIRAKQAEQASGAGSPPGASGPPSGSPAPAPPSSGASSGADEGGGAAPTSASSPGVDPGPAPAGDTAHGEDAEADAGDAPPAKPPPEPSQEELVGWLEKALAALGTQIREENAKITWREGAAEGFDLFLEGSKDAERYRIYGVSTETLSAEGLEAAAAKVEAHLAEQRASLQRRYSVLVLLGLELDDPAATRAAYRDRNIAQLATLSRKRGDTLLVGFLHVPSGELHLPFFRTIPPSFRRLRAVPGLY